MILESRVRARDEGAALGSHESPGAVRPLGFPVWNGGGGFLRHPWLGAGAETVVLITTGPQELGLRFGEVGFGLEWPLKNSQQRLPPSPVGLWWTRRRDASASSA